ncbi:alpha/beta hydrolase [Flavobacterium aquidurense]|uniref:alpha/beta hydrolase n=1 Tax=Flavobacterium aquidurense TaxID=362413 RepID=UPI00286438BC|nr:alpha/beta hydrolase [Flavobacterium aquidurense]MDR7370293.1 acetyl esterase/lipase [Flavobacterium aquidurense]
MKNAILIFLFITSINATLSQEIIPLWENGKMPNSRGMKLNKIEDNERITQVDVPSIYAFFTSREENTAAAVLIFPPGGYKKLTYDIAGFQLAKWFNTFGVNAFVVMYRLPSSPDLTNPAFGPIMDGQRAIKIVRSHASKWGIDPMKIGVMGASAGGGLAANLATVTTDYAQTKDDLDFVSIQPNFQILVSGAISMKQNAHKGSYEALLGTNPKPENEQLFSGELNVTAATPPAFVICAADDHVVNPLNSIQYYQALIKNNVKAALHIFPQGDHAIALRNNPGSTQLWPALCEAWLSEMKFLTKPHN